ncbi:helix-turn-helix domain-containing protein [Nafulsella turpanensis]|uniref:helix-turn-helix domain-containing protein n=1 Tax=Nafulsella turpanensis TaxID=1265690 RepID=UPI000366E673|nr:helix-turn-helix domain-containing protein [Nafulsella turpanensis]
MDKKILISLEPEEFRTILIDSVNSCLKYHQHNFLPSENEEGDIVPVQGAADFLDISIPTIYGYVQRREIPFHKRGKRLYFSKKELTEWIKAGRIKTVSEIEEEAVTSLVSSRKGGKNA